mgnify:CR=1 FL=1
MAYDETVTDWIKVSDRLPEDGQLCIIIANNSKLIHLAQWNQRLRIFEVKDKKIGYYKSALKYWMPIVLPEE